MSDIAGIMIPLLLHLLCSEMVAVVFGGKLDAAARTLVVALIVLPWAVWMYRRDGRTLANEGKRNVPGATVKSSPKRDENVRRKRNDAENEVSDETETSDWIRNILRCLCCLAAGGILNLIWSSCMNLLGLQQHFSNETQTELLAGQLLVQIVSMGFLVPVTEELVFRGLIYRRMRKLLPYLQAVILASALFAVYHGNVIQMVFAFPMAIVICIFYEKWKLLQYPILFHMGSNLMAIMMNIV